jgi:hypothetical protein
MVMVAVLFLLIGYQAMLASLWDVATDGLSWVFLWLTASTIGIGSAMLMAWSLPRRQLWVPILFALTVPLVLVQAHNLANYERDHTWGTKPILTTERRADKIERAIQRYYERSRPIPQNALADLTPRYLLYVPNPFIIPGLDWCYEGGVDFYRFGYVHRQYFSVPASVRIHSSAGEPPVPQLEMRGRCGTSTARPLVFELMDNKLFSRLKKEEYCYLTTTGRVTGNPHEIEIWFGLNGNTLYLLSGGMDRSDWVKNLIKNPSVKVRVGRNTFSGTARLVKGQ